GWGGGGRRGAAPTVRREGDALVPVEDPFEAFAAGREARDLGDPVVGELLAPCEPLVVVGIAQNGPDHASPVQAWLKSPRTVVPSGRVVCLRRDAGQVVAEGEIAVVIGRPTAGLTPETAHEFVLGITAVDDLSSPDRAAWDPRNFESKSGEGYTPLGPWIDTRADIDDVDVELAVGDRRPIRMSSDELPVGIRDCLAYVAAWSELGPGDVVMTGAPRALCPVDPGETISVRVGEVRLVTPTA
ncbi:fumarylacetoacetate hydrolase family protein, partial [Microbacterium sp. gxy059]|uniref:fumarylacetoacetate hydrolase family protein n=1 Tax=Microbacterium sp. gxy059 TaxID=2957199 RepID=UPI003D967383